MKDVAQRPVGVTIASRLAMALGTLGIGLAFLALFMGAWLPDLPFMRTLLDLPYVMVLAIPLAGILSIVAGQGGLAGFPWAPWVLAALYVGGLVLSVRGPWDAAHVVVVILDLVALGMLLAPSSRAWFATGAPHG